MLNSKLVTGLRALDNYEAKRFEKFLNSPYFNTRSDVIKLYGCLMELITTENGDFSKEPIAEWMKISPQELTHLNSYLLDLLLNFWKIEAFQRSEEEQSSGSAMLASKLILSQLPKLYRPLLRKEIKRLESSKALTAISRFGLYRLYYLHAATLRGAGYTKRRNPSLEKANEQIDKVYFAVKFGLAGAMVQRNGMLADKHYIQNHWILDHNDLELNFKEQDLELEILRFGYLRLSQQFDIKRDAHAFEELLLRGCESDNQIVKVQSYSRLLNHYVEMSHAGFEEAISSHLKLLEKRLEDPSLRGSFKVTSTIVRTGVVDAILLQDTIKARKFLEKYSKQLDLSVQAPATCYIMALILFAEKKFEDCLNQIEQSTMYTQFEALGYYKLKLRACFELRRYDLVTKELKNHLAHLRYTKNISAVDEKRNRNYNKCISILLEPDTNARKKINGELWDMVTLDKVWVKEKLKTTEPAPEAGSASSNV